MAEETSKHIIGSAPFFLVADVKKAAAYYREILGFSYGQLWGDPPEFCMAKRDGFIVMLCRFRDNLRIAPNHTITKESETWDAYFWVKDARALFSEFRENGAHVVYEPVVRDAYDMVEFAVRDPDGYVLAFGQDLPTNA